MKLTVSDSAVGSALTGFNMATGPVLTDQASQIGVPLRYSALGLTRWGQGGVGTETEFRSFGAATIVPVLFEGFYPNPPTDGPFGPIFSETPFSILKQFSMVRATAKFDNWMFPGLSPITINGLTEAPNPVNFFPTQITGLRAPDAHSSFLETPTWMPSILFGPPSFITAGLYEYHNNYVEAVENWVSDALLTRKNRLSYEVGSKSIIIETTNLYSIQDIYNISKNQFSELIQMLSGDDTIQSSVGNDYLFGLTGSDVIFGGGGSDRMYGGDGGDVLFGDDHFGSGLAIKLGLSPVFLSGSPGDDRLVGGYGADIFIGGGGNDTIDAIETSSDDWNISFGDQPQYAVDKIEGGAGRDTFWVDNLDQVFDFEVQDSIQFYTRYSTKHTLIEYDPVAGTFIKVFADTNGAPNFQVYDVIFLENAPPADQLQLFRFDDSNGYGLDIRRLSTQENSAFKGVTSAVNLAQSGALSRLAEALTKNATLWAAENYLQVNYASRFGKSIEDSLGRLLPSGIADAIANLTFDMTGIISKLRAGEYEGRPASLFDDCVGMTVGFLFRRIPGADLAATSLYETGKWAGYEVGLGLWEFIGEQIGNANMVADAEAVRAMRNGSSGSQDINGSARPDKIWVFGGNDTVRAGAGDDVVEGGEGNDWIHGEDGHDLLLGGESASSASSTSPAYSSASSEIVQIESDTINGGDGNDTLTGGSGADSLDGGDGFDTTSFSSSAARVIVNLFTGQGFEGEAAGDRYSGIESAIASNFDDIVVGTAAANFLDGITGRDTLYGNAGNDTLLGGEGNDTIFGEQDNDLAFGWLGADVLWGGDGNDTLWGEQDNDTLLGEVGNDVLLGVDGNDVMYGWLGNDSLYGWFGADVLWGEQGNDLMLGEDGDDIFIGGLGRDTMTGGQGADRFFSAFSEIAAGEVDLITDYDTADRYLFQTGAQIQYFNFNAPGYVGAGIHVQVAGGVFILDVFGANAAQLQAQTLFF